VPEIAQTADHALRILEELGRGVALSPIDLAERLDLNRTVVHRLLVTLNARGFVSRQGMLYQPGATLIRLANSIEPDLRAAAGPIMKRLAERIHESVVLHVLDGVDAVVLDQAVYDGHVLQVSHRIGSRHALAQGASGRAILAFQPDAIVRKVLKHSDAPNAIERNISAVVQMRYSLSHDELQMGVHGLAVPLLTKGGFALGSLAALVPVGRARGLEDHVDALWASADEIMRSYASAGAG
jgi:DNA-binding IclR family transcriptional regulator